MKKVWYQWYDDHVPMSVDVPDTTVKELFNLRAEEEPENPYLIADDKIYSYRRCNSMARQLANGLLELGVEQGDRVALLAPNVIQWVISRHACHKIGAIVVPMNPRSTRREIIHFFKDSGATTAIVNAPNAKNLIETYHAGDTGLKQVIVFPGGTEKGETKEASGILDFDILIESQSDNEPVIDVSQNDVAVLQYTGGTTGVSKACALTHFNLVAMAFQTAAWFKPVLFGSEIRTLAALPLYHVFGFNMNINLNLVAGGSVVLVSNPAPKNILDMIGRYKPNLFAAVPTMLVGLTQYPEIGSLFAGVIKTIVSGGAPLPVQIMKEFETLSGVSITEGYGLSEITTVLTTNPLRTKKKIGSIGIPWPNVDLKIVDLEKGVDEMPVGEPGELIAKTPTLMVEYWNNPDQTQQVVRNGWFYTGDVAYMDEDGFFFIAGRKKEMILVGGFNVYPSEIDDVMHTHPKVLESCTVGVPDVTRGEVVKIFIVMKAGEVMSEKEVIGFCREHLVSYKVPKIVEFIDKIPLTPVGKPDRKALSHL